MAQKTGILLLNLGGPDSLEAIKPFLYNLFSDPDIIRLPFSWLLQKPIAWWIAETRTVTVQDYYQQMGGRSPILPLTQAQGDALQTELADKGHDVSVYLGMRYWHPFIETAVSQILQDGIEDLIILPLYPQYSLTTTGSSLNEFYRVLAQHGKPKLRVRVIPPYYDDSNFQAALAATIEEGLTSHPWTCERDDVQILFSAHSLPKKFVKKTGDPYPQQIYQTAQQVIENFFPQNPWDLSYQSKVGNMPWLGPDTEGALHYFAARNVENILMVPLSFVSDHLETLYELDILYRGVAYELKIPHCYRAKALNDHPLFIQALTTLVEEALKEPASPFSLSGVH